MSTSTVTPEIAAFAQGVRAALSDLPSEEVDDLTEGLEADLAEAYAEDLQRELPDPLAYATELRSAAGLPIRTTTKRGALSGLVDGWSETRRDLMIALRRNPALAAALEFLAVLRPLWWAARAWLATWLLAAFFGMEEGYWFNGVWWIVLLAFVVISVQWGRGLWRAKGVPALIVLGNVVAVVALLPVLAAADGWGGDDYGIGYEDGVAGATNEPAALALRGEPITNIYAYDASGKPLRDVQLFDQDGKPLAAFSAELDENACGDEDCSTLAQPGRLETGQPVFNVFPLGTVAAQWDDETGATVPKPGATAAVPEAPFLKVPGLFVPEKVAKPNR